MRDAARHLPDGAQALLLQHRVLRLAQVVIGALQRAVQLCLVRGERHVLAQLSQELAVDAREARRLAPRRDEHAENLAFNQQGRGDERCEPPAREALRKWKAGGADVGFIDETSAHATAEAVPVRSEEHTSELQSPCNLVCRLLLEKKKTNR